MSSLSCQHCGTEKAVGFVRTESPTKVMHNDFRLCMKDIIDLERWLENKPNAKGEYPALIWTRQISTADTV